MAGPERTVIEAQLAHMSEDIREIKLALHGSYVTKEAFGPVRALVYGLVGVIMVSVITALLMLVMGGGGGHK